MPLLNRCAFTVYSHKTENAHGYPREPLPCPTPLSFIPELSSSDPSVICILPLPIENSSHKIIPSSDLASPLLSFQRWLGVNYPCRFLFISKRIFVFCKAGEKGAGKGVEENRFRKGKRIWVLAGAGGCWRVLAGTGM